MNDLYTFNYEGAFRNNKMGMPGKLRETLQKNCYEDSWRNLHILPMNDFGLKYLAVYDDDIWQRIERASGLFSDFSRKVWEEAKDLEQPATIGKDNRFAIASEFAQHLGLENKVTVAGCGDRIEIFNPLDYQRIMKDVDFGRIYQRLHFEYLLEQLEEQGIQLPDTMVLVTIDFLDKIPDN
jgi:DNA-binding transcriptional regulator/RsmH inhibitor MraZ